MNKNILLIGLGHKARQGKDIIANYLHNKYPSSAIIHWADALYNELRNKERKHFLIKKEEVHLGDLSEKTFYLLYDKTIDNNFSYKVFRKVDIPEIAAIMEERGLSEYWGMDEKDAPMLQAWGTNYRRKYCDTDYWVKAGLESAKVKGKDSDSNSPFVIFIPDTRFINELDALRFNNGYYWEIQRTEPDGSRFIAQDRDPNHPSEIELDIAINKANYDELLTAKSGDLDSLYTKASVLLDNCIFEWMNNIMEAA